MTAVGFSHRRWSALFKCYVDRIIYHVGEQMGEVWVPENSCTDMQGAIDFFQSIDPSVQAISVWAGDRIDIAYARTGRKWKAIELRIVEDAHLHGTLQ